MIEPINFSAALRRSWRLLAVLALLGGVIAVLLPVSHPPSQKGSPTKWLATALVGAPPSNGIVGTVVSANQILFYANSYEVKSEALFAAKPPGNFLDLLGTMSASPQSTKSAAGGSSTATTVAASSKASAKNATGLIQLAAPGATPSIATTLANDWTTALGNKLEAVAAARQASTSSTKTSSSGSGSTPSTSTGYEVILPAMASQAKKAKQPSSGLTSSHKVRLLIGLVLGLLVGAAIVLVREVLNKRIQKASRAAAHLKFPVVAEIPEAVPAAPGMRTAPVVVAEPTSTAAEVYRKLRMSVMFEAMAPAGSHLSSATDPFADLSMAMPAEPYRRPDVGSRTVILVVSPAAEPSRPEVVANLGATYAEAGQRVIVTMTADLDSGAPAGFGANLTGDVTPADIAAHLQPSSVENLSTLSLRPFVRNSAQLVTRAAGVFDAARQVADVVIVEAPPFLELHHGEALVHSVDVILVVAESGVTTFGDADETGVLLRRLGAPVLGVVFTGVPIPKRDKARYADTGTEGPPPEARVDEPTAMTPEVPTMLPAKSQA